MTQWHLFCCCFLVYYRLYSTSKYVLKVRNKISIPVLQNYIIHVHIFNYRVLIFQILLPGLNYLVMFRYKKLIRSSKDEAFLQNKVYSFKEPPPPPSIKEIYANSEFTDPLPQCEADVEPAEKDERRPTWLVRGDLSSLSPVEDMLQLEYAQLSHLFINNPSLCMHVYLSPPYTELEL